MQIKKLHIGFSIFLLVLLSPFILLAADYYVAPTASGIGDCSSEDDACGFQTALDTAAINGDDDTIHLLAGTYDASVAEFIYNPAENHALTIVGAGGDVTILDGGNAKRMLYITTTALSDDSNAHITIRGLTFQNGKGHAGVGGGLSVRANSANITIEDSRFSGNSGNLGGGANVYSRSGTITLINNIFSDNSNDSYSSGGGVYVYSDSGTTILSNNNFSGNIAHLGGGGAWVRSDSRTVILTSNTFSGNSAENGGGAFLSSNTGTVILSNNTFSGNSATDDLGGGAYAGTYSGTVTLTNNTFSGNIADHRGGGIYIFLQLSTATANIFNNIVWGNTADWGFDIYLNAQNKGTLNLCSNDYSDFYSLNPCNLHEENNINADPLFVDTDNGDYHLQAVSPCIDQGDPAAPELPDTDFEGDDRVIGAAPDMGADEFALVTIQDILTFFDESVDDGTLSGRGRGWLAKLRLCLMKQMLLIAGEFIEHDRINAACFMLQRAYLRSDGLPWPRDFVEGEATDKLADMIWDLRVGLGCG